MKLSFKGKRCDLCRLLHCLCGGRQIVRVATYSFKGISFTAKGNNMALVVKDTDVPGTVTASITYVDAKGKPAKVDGAPTWVASDATIVDTVTPAADGMSAVLHITDTIGVSQITISADVDLGAGVTPLDTVDTVSVIAGDAVAGNLTFGTITHD